MLLDPKSCQGTKPKAPTSYTINCVMFSAPEFPQLGSVDRRSWGSAGGREAVGTQKERRRVACSPVTVLEPREVPGARRGLWRLLPSLLPTSVVMLCGLEAGKQARMVVTLHSPTQARSLPVFDPSPGAFLLPFWGSL